MANSKDRAELLRRVREKMLQRKGGRKRDPNEWKAPQVQAGKRAKFKVHILPPTGSVWPHSSHNAMDDLWYIQVGDHWVKQGGSKKRFPCPRVYDGDECPYCQLGFDLLNETDDKKARSDISRTYLPRTQYVVNIRFTEDAVNPPELQGKVMFYAMPKTLFDKLDECLQRNDAGDDEDNPDPFGLFYLPEDAYPLSVVITHKGGYNNYEKSELLANARRPIGTEEEIEAILEQRHDLTDKYPARTDEVRKALQQLCDDDINGADDDDNDGFDADETETKTEVKSTPPVKAESAPEATAESEEAPSASVDVDDEELQQLLKSIKEES